MWSQHEIALNLSGSHTASVSLAVMSRTWKNTVWLQDYPTMLPWNYIANVFILFQNFHKNPFLFDRVLKWSPRKKCRHIWENRYSVLARLMKTYTNLPSVKLYMVILGINNCFISFCCIYVKFEWSRNDLRNLCLYKVYQYYKWTAYVAYRPKSIIPVCGAIGEALALCYLMPIAESKMWQNLWSYWQILKALGLVCPYGLFHKEADG